MTVVVAAFDGDNDDGEDDDLHLMMREVGLSKKDDANKCQYFFQWCCGE